ncbi:MAG TPA: apolipoprotein N-acyltransferase [Verrucomicrobiota bacterium]|nr:apolipoprotein N-acyltransferase [Verrucomicrobiota bacterium]
MNRRTGLACLAGLTWALSFPTPNIAGLAWLAPGLLAFSALGSPARTGLRLGYLAGLVHFLISLRWLLHIPFPAGAVAGWIALSAYCALYPAVWLWFSIRCLPTPAASPSPEAPAGAGTGSQRWRSPLAGLTALQRIRWNLLCAAAWVALEMILARLFSGFPWNLMGVSQYRQLPLIQIADVTGVYGISFLVVWASLALLCAALEAVTRPFRPPPPASPASSPLPTCHGPPRPLFLPFRIPLLSFSDLALPLVVLLCVSFQGAVRLITPPPAGRELNIALVQPSIPQRLIFDPRETTNRFNALIELSQLALAANPDLLVWPEASLPGLSEDHFRVLTNLIATHQVWMIFGADDVEPPPPDQPEGTPRYYNSAFLFGPDGRFRETYRKQRLVIFGEYIPFERFLPFMKHLTPIGASFTAGDGPVPFILDQPTARVLDLWNEWSTGQVRSLPFQTHPPAFEDSTLARRGREGGLAPQGLHESEASTGSEARLARVSVLICFEDVFPHGVRHAVEPDTDFLLNLTNNGWFGESAAQWQHAANAVFRAVENGRPLVRCTNNGITCWIDRRGRRHGLDSRTPADAYRAGFRSFRLTLPADGTSRHPTFYRRHGDVFGWSCVSLTALALAFGLLPRRGRSSIGGDNTARAGRPRDPAPQSPAAGSASRSSHP